MKWIGLIFLILCGAMAGMACSGKLRMKLEQTEKLCSFLREMGVLMQYQYARGIAGYLFQPFHLPRVPVLIPDSGAYAAADSICTSLVRTGAGRKASFTRSQRSFAGVGGRTWDNGFGGAAFRLVTGTYSIAAVSGYLPCYVSEKRKALPQFGVAGWIAAGSSFLLRK